MNDFFCETKNLAMGYGKAPLAEAIALGVRRGQILTLIGPNGAGKSTLLKTLAGQLAPLGGTVLLGGQDLAAYTGTARAQRLALMLPHTRRTELTTCFEFAAAGRIPYTGRLGILSEADKQAVRDALALVGASHLADRDFNCISDGQRQRILLARAICQQPEILLLDEPTSFLDIKGKIELLTILQKLAHQQHLAVIVSLHELDMAQKIADAVVCVSPQGISGVLTAKEAFAPENIQALYDLSREQYEALFGPPKPSRPKFEHYVRSGQKLLRCGYTTGTCAALGAAGAARLLLTGNPPETVALRTPKGIVVEVAPLFCRKTDAGAECAIEKDGGDDVDVTTGLPVIASVALLPDTTDIRISGGKGVGRVTKPGLDQPVGEAAINHVPRQMIAEALKREAENACYTGGFAVTLSIKGGEEDYFKEPETITGSGTGFWEAPRGALYHHEDVKDGKITGYQIIIPSTWNLAPINADGVHGPLEQALIGIPVADIEMPINALRTVHSFDPCTACAVHVSQPSTGKHFETVTNPWGVK